MKNENTAQDKECQIGFVVARVENGNTITNYFVPYHFAVQVQNEKFKKELLKEKKEKKADTSQKQITYKNLYDSLPDFENDQSAGTSASSGIQTIRDTPQASYSGCLTPARPYYHQFPLVQYTLPPQLHPMQSLNNNQYCYFVLI